MFKRGKLILLHIDINIHFLNPIDYSDSDFSLRVTELYWPVDDRFLFALALSRDRA